MTSAGTTPQERPKRNRAAGWLVAGLVLVPALVALAAFLLLGNVLEETAEPVAPVTDDVEEGQVSSELFDDAELGSTKERVTQLLLPARPVDTRVLAEYQQREPETPASSCVYYEAEPGVADALFRFCFVEDELVDKTVILPDDSGPAD